MKYSFYFLFAFFTFSGYSQDTIKRFYIPIQQYVQQGKYLTKQDSLNFQYKGVDTLIRVSQEFIEDLYRDLVPVEYEPKDSLFLEIYKEVVYGKPNTEARNSQAMKYWKDEIRIYFDPGVPKAHTEHLMDFALEISSGIDSLKISQVGTQEESNYLIYYVNRDYVTEYEPRITTPLGGYYINWKPNHQIYKGSLKINTEYAKNEDYQLQLLTYHFFQSLGYFKSSDILECESYLSGCSNYRKLTPIDREILAYHYSYGICKGVKIETFEEMHQHMHNALVKDPITKQYVYHAK